MDIMDEISSRRVRYNEVKAQGIIKFYEDLTTTSYPCVRLLNSTGAIGCQSLQPVTGILYPINTSDDIKQFIGQDLNGKFAIVMPYDLMKIQNLRDLESSHKLGGVIVIINGTSDFAPRPTAFSPDETCPNCQYGLYRDEENQYQWNPNGLGLIQERFDFPIFALYPFDDHTTSTYNRVMKGAAENMENSFKNYPLRAVELSSLMWSAIDASTCLRRDFCQPVGGQSVYSTSSVNISNDDNKPIIVVAAAMDSRSLFHMLTLGVDNGVSGTIALLAVADAISRSQVEINRLPKHILYTLFYGEAWGFAGSSRFVSDITQFNCQVKGSAKGCPFKNEKNGCGFPCKQNLDFTRINFTNIESIFEFSQVGMGTTGFYVHVDSNSTSNVELINKMNNISATINNGSAFVYAASANGTNLKLPPSSSMSFLEKNRSLTAVVLGDFQSNLKDEYDDGFNVSDDSMVDSICSIANVTAQTVWLQAQGPNYSNIPISVNLKKNDVERIGHYSSVFQYDMPGWLPTFAYNYLLSLNSSRAPCKASTDCQNDERCFMGKCTNTITRYHDAYGAGLQYNRNGNAMVTDPTKATWVESKWGSNNMRIFLVSSQFNQICELLFGCILTILSIIGVLYGKKQLNKTLKIA
ncbi:Nicastrin-domain-containing protein [Gigaspora rosea]|uniref:Nicastrin n=1 Tax=Gigaspora rosea TaxID=44941 RepID=A0A397VW87_9GLOM|nr:Nicastrin-domain-containing protein [Gigaspora rosea]